jgi:diaminohydroxyphosphoribosylaminopyrimidine deaminase / 5-amino-6-(5-phosphoribosylamino)uracil reductase
MSGIVSKYDWRHVNEGITALLSDGTPPEEKVRFMQQAIDVALDKGSPSTVGAVIINNGEVVSLGYRHIAFLDKYPLGRIVHAEDHALQQAGDDAQGATLYATLEPCYRRGRGSKVNGITPCSELIIQSGITRVVIGVVEARRRQRGRGIRRLANAGIRIESCYLGLERQLYDLVGDGNFRTKRL